MFAEIFASLATGFAAQFGAPFQDVVARWPGKASYDDGGSIVSPGTPVEKPCKAQFDAPTEAMRNDPGFLENDVRLIILTATLDGTLDRTAKIVVDEGANAGEWVLQSITGDSAGIGWECRARRTS